MAKANTKSSKSSSKAAKSSKQARKATRESRLAPLGYKSRTEMIAKARSIQLDDGMTIKVLVKENPKRGKSGKRFASYKNGMKVAAALEKMSRQDIRWDAAHKYIALSKH